jgi:protease I
VRAIDKDGKLVAGHLPWTLGTVFHGSLKGKRATAFFSIKDDCVNAGAIWEDAEVVVDDNLVTVAQADDLPAFCRASIE